MKSELADSFRNSFKKNAICFNLQDTNKNNLGIQEFWCSRCEWKSNEKLTEMYMNAYGASIVAAAFLLMLLFKRSSAEPSPPADTMAL